MNHTVLLPALLASALLSPGALQAQRLEAPVSPVREAVYAEAGGPVGVASLNYDRMIADHWAVRLGLEVDGSGAHVSDWYPEIPMTVSYLAFTGDHRAEIGGGAVLTAGSPHNDGLESTVHLGYRYQPMAPGIFFRATLVHRESGRYELPGLPIWGGLGFGYAF